LQEDLRRERSQFFIQTLREVVQTLNYQQIEKTVASHWIEELVASYTKSIDLSSDLTKTHVVQVSSFQRRS
jgi:response regulator RpfG family c-di-GMP phosphodiesterase